LALKCRRKLSRLLCSMNTKVGFNICICFSHLSYFKSTDIHFVGCYTFQKSFVRLQDAIYSLPLSCSRRRTSGGSSPKILGGGHCPCLPLHHRVYFLCSSKPKKIRTSYTVCAKKVTPFWYLSFLPFLDALYLQFLFTLTYHLH